MARLGNFHLSDTYPIQVECSTSAQLQRPGAKNALFLSITRGALEVKFLSPETDDRGTRAGFTETVKVMSRQCCSSASPKLLSVENS